MSFSANLNSSIPAELADELLKKLAYVSEALVECEFVSGGRDQVSFRLQQGQEHQAQTVAGRIVEVADKLSKTRVPPSAKVLVSRKDRPASFSADPHPELEARGELFRYGSGRYGFGPLLTRLMSLFDRDACGLAARMAATPHQFPSLIGADALDRCRYLRTFPSALTLVSHLREDSEAIQKFAGEARWDGNHLVHSPESLSSIQCLLAPSVCFHYYAWLQDRQLPGPSCITALGKCFRYESRSMAGLERLWDFAMREVIFAGPQQYVLDQRRRVMDLTVELLDRWDLRYEIRSATDPFFIEDYASMAAFQLAFELKFEILAPLPYKQKDLAIGSLNYHQDFFGRSFNFTGPQGEPFCTGCLGYGLERVVLAFLAQHGLDPDCWPAAIAAEFSRPE